MARKVSFIGALSLRNGEKVVVKMEGGSEIVRGIKGEAGYDNMSLIGGSDTKNGKRMQRVEISSDQGQRIFVAAKIHNCAWSWLVGKNEIKGDFEYIQILKR